MDWTRHRGGIHRAEDGHVVKRQDADAFALWRPGASIDDEPAGVFATLDAARAAAENGELVATAAATTTDDEQPRKPRGRKGTKVSDTKHAKGSTRGNTLEARMERAAQAAEGQGLDDFANVARTLLEGNGKKPAKTWGAKLRAALPEDRDDKAVKIATRLAGRFEADLDDDKRLKQIYADAYYLERA